MKDNSTQTRVTLAIGFIAMLLTALYIIVQFVPYNENDIVSFLIYLILVIYNAFIIAGFVIFLILQAGAYKRKKPFEIYHYDYNKTVIDWFYDKSVDNFIKYPLLGFVAGIYIYTFNHVKIALIWRILIALIGTLIFYTILYILWKIFSSHIKKEYLK